jgi:hypothetical protein
MPKKTLVRIEKWIPSIMLASSFLYKLY